jgi:membrane associated rhomboid family serine protease
MVVIRRTATNALILIICAAYLAQQLIPDLQTQLLLPGLDYLQYTNEWYRLITVALTHGGLMHLGFNMYSLYILGTPIESAYGRNKFLVIFTVSLLTGSFTSVFFNNGNFVSVGASGAVFGLFGAFLIVGKTIGVNIREIAIIIGLNFVVGFILGGVDWRAHLGGLLGGALAAQLILSRRRR